MTYTLHPAEIFYNLSRYSFLLTLPVARMLTNINTRFEFWLEFIWLDGAIISVIVLLSLLRWKTTQISLSGNRLSCSYGIIFRVKTEYSVGDICSHALEYPFVWSAFHACRFVADTKGGVKYNKVNVSCLLHARDAEALSQAVSVESVKACRKVYKPHAFYLFLLSVITSNGLTGVLLISAFVRESGKIIGIGLTEQWNNTLSFLSETTAGFIPPVASAAAWTLILGWIVALLLSLLRYAKYTVCSGTDSLRIQTGLFTRRIYELRRDSFHFLDIRRNLFNLVTGAASVFISISGYGYRKGESPVIIPAESNRQLQALLKILFPRICSSPIQIRSHPSVWPRYLILPLFMIFIVFGVNLIPLPISYPFRELIVFASKMIGAVGLFFLLFRIIALRQAGIGSMGNCLSILSHKGFYLHTVLIPFDEISSVNLYRMWGIKRWDLCDVKVEIGTKYRQHFTVIGIPYEKAKQILRLNPSKSNEFL